MTSTQVADAVATAMANNLLPAGAYREVDAPFDFAFNNNNSTAQAQNLEAVSWTTTANSLITDSTTLPHVTIFGTSFWQSNTDYYRFDVPANNSRVVVDVDGLQANFNTVVRILNSSGTVIFSNTTGGVIDPGSNALSSYLDVLLNSGTYYIQIGQASGASGAFPEQPYALHLSVAGHAVDANGVAAPLAVNREVIKTHVNMVRMIRHTVTDAGPMSLMTSKPGDAFGASSTGYDQNWANRRGALRSMNNAVEGVYVDDIVLGFAERGEMIINAGVNTSFIQNEDIDEANYIDGNDYLGIDLGAYDVEIRRTNDYGLTLEESPTNFLYRAIDTNDRNGELTSLTIPQSWRIADGGTITLWDGVNSVVFEFNQVGGATTTQGAFPVSFDPIAGETSISLAAKLRDAINSTLVQSLLKIKASLSDGVDLGGSSTSSRLHLTGNVIVTLSADLVSSVLVEDFVGTYGDQNQHRDQGQLIIRESSITDSSQFGVVADASPRGANSDIPGPGSVRNLHTINDEGLVTGVVIMNNVIAANLGGGIRFSGDQAGGPAGPVPYGRIINNTIVGVGGGLGSGILVEQSASPTILNNIIVDFGTGINVDLSSIAAGTTIGSSLYSGNTVNSTMGPGAFPISLLTGEPLFVDKANRNYYLAPNSRAIDSSLTSLGDRDEILRVKQPMDLDGREDKGSPIIAPEFDLYGQLRGNDPDMETPAGQGGSVLFDRGAIDRVDFAQPQVQLANPEDQSALDGDADIDEVWIDQVQTLRQIRIRLFDEGIGIDNRTINKNQFALKRVLGDGVTTVLLVEGVDYQFAYNEVNREVILTAATVFADKDTEVRYILTIDNDGLSVGDTIDGPRDLAGNYLLPNRSDGTTRFDIVLTDGVNDPPEITAPVFISMVEDTSFLFTGSQAVSIFDQDAHLGSNVLTVTLTAVSGVTILGSVPSGLSFTMGSSALNAENAVAKFTGSLQDLNTALNGLRFKPTSNFSGFAKLTIVVDDMGEFSGAAAISTKDIDIDVTPVNDPPTYNLAPVVTVNEDAGLLSVGNGNFIQSLNSGAPNEVLSLGAGSVTISTVSVPTGSFWTKDEFFLVAPSYDFVNNNLTFRTAQDVNGSITLRVNLIDGPNTVSKTFVLTVNALNDAPVPNPKFNNPINEVPRRILISGLEDASLVQQINVALVNSFSMGPSTARDEVAQSPVWSIVNYTRTFGNLLFDPIQIGDDGSLGYRALKDTAGTATFDVLLRDTGGSGGLNVDSAALFRVEITIVEENDAPVAVTGNYVVDEGYSLNLNAGGSYDVDAPFGDTLTYAWDLNNDGDYNDAGEAAGSSQTRTITWAQLVSLGITAPQTRTIKLRVTDSRNKPNSSTVVNSTLQTLIVDYGDAPDSYGTLKGSNGAAHTITGNLTLGMTRDNESQPGPSVIQDGADEDGVTFPTTLEMSPDGPLPAYVDVYSSGVGKLDIWLDLNRNGVFDHNATEHLGNKSWAVKAGVNRIFFTIPAGTPDFATMMRFRLTSTGHAAVLPTGRANDGEVEDYSVHVSPLRPAVSPDINLPIDFNTADGQIAQTTDSTPTIAWSLHDRNFNYELIVRNKTTNEIVYSRLKAANYTATSDTVSTLLPEGLYTVSLTAFNKAGVGASASTIEFRVVKIAISSPTRSVNTSRPTIVWNHVPGTKAYTIEVYSSSSNTLAFRQTVPTSSMAIPGQFTLPANLPLANYYTRIQAIDAADLPGDWSANQHFFVRTAPVVLQPTAVVITPLPQIAWTPITGAVSYDVQLFNLTDNVLVLSVTGVQGASWSPTSPLSLARYRVVVTARGAGGFVGLASNPFVFSYAPVPKILAPGGRLPDSTPTFGWQAVPSANLYRLVVRQDFGSFAEVYRHNSLTGTIHTLPFSLPLGRYSFSVVAINTAAAGSGQLDAVSSVSLETTFAVVTPPVVLGLQGTSGPVLTTFLTRPTVLWTNPPQTPSTAKSQLQVFRMDGLNRVLVVSQSNIVGTSMLMPTLGLGTYVVRVRTASLADPATGSDWSIEKTFRVTVAPKLIGPTGAVTDSTPTLNWSGVTGGQTYQIEVMSLSKNVIVFAESGLNALNYTVPSTLPIGRYQFRVQARSAFGELSSWSDTMDFQIVGGPTLIGPASSTFNTRPSFSWTDMSGTVSGSAAVNTVYDFRLDMILPNNVTQVGFRTALGLTSPSYTLPVALPAGRYRAMVLARTFDTTSNYSNVVEFYVGGNPVVNAIGSTTDTTPTISWKSVDGASGYQVFIALDSNPTVAVVQQLGIGSLSYTPTTPLAKGKYRAWVRAVNASNGQLSGPALTDAPSIIFTITDASENRSQELPGHYTMALLPVNMDDVVSESTISMLPAFVSGSQQPVVVVSEQSVDSSIQLKASVPAESANVAEVAPENVPQTDEILSQWGEQKWWDAVPVAAMASEVSVPETQPVTSAASGILGALLALAPRSLRRRKKDESAK